MNKLSKEQLAWAAGIMDGEGSFMLSYRPATTDDQVKSKWGKSPLRDSNIPHHLKYPRRTDSYIKICSLPNTELRLIRLFQSWFNGSISTVKMPEDTNQKQLYVWRISATSTVVPFLESIKPYLFLKRRQADILLEFCNTIQVDYRNKLVDKETSEYRYKIYSELRKLNRRGRAAAETKRKDGGDVPKR